MSHTNIVHLIQAKWNPNPICPELGSQKACGHSKDTHRRGTVIERYLNGKRQWCERLK